MKTLVHSHHRVLKIALFINLLMFFIEVISGWIAHSSALLADSLDMLGDAFVYAISLYAIHKSTKWNASISIIKGGLMSVLGVGVLFHAIVKFKGAELPMAETMGIIGSLALAANLICAILLLRHRNDNINMRSTWLCSRNDVLVNIAVLIAAALVSITQSKYPDLIVGIGISVLVLVSAISIFKDALQSFSQKS